MINSNKTSVGKKKTDVLYIFSLSVTDKLEQKSMHCYVIRQGL